MGEETGIAWCDATFNPWHGCTKVSPACKNCYAAAFDKRLGRDNWGDAALRHFFGDKHWNDPRRWDRAAAKAGVRKRVFCASMADVFEDRDDLLAPRSRLYDLIVETPHLDWLLLTKRPENVYRLYPKAWISQVTPSNIWLGTTVEDQFYADQRIPALLSVPAVVHFLSCEPLLGPIDLSPYLRAWPGASHRAAIDWVITGSESGFGRRDSDVDWYRMLRDQCAAAGQDVGGVLGRRVAFFLKQAREVDVDRCETCGKKVRYHVCGPGDALASCDCTVEGAESCAAPPIGSGEGSWTKKDGTIEQPYLDGRQHIEFPVPRWQQV